MKEGKTRPSQEKLDEVILLYIEQRLSAREAARRVGLSKNSVLRELSRRGLSARSVNETRKGTSALLTAEQISEIHRLYQEHNVSSVELAKRYSVSRTTVSHWLHRNGVKMQKGGRPLLQHLTDEIVAQHKKGMTIKKIAREYEVTPECISSLFKRSNTTIRDAKFERKYNVNHNFFSTWTAESAYVLGFISADGCVSGSGLISITQHSKDVDVLEKIAIAMQSEYPLGTGVNQWGTPYHRMSIRSPKMCRDLLKLGVTPRKSLTLQACFEVPPEYLRHYIRGLVDGDGWVVIARSKTGCIRGQVGLCGSHSIVHFFKDYAVSICNTKSAPFPRKKIHYFRVDGTQKAAALLSILYQDGDIAMSRKCDHANKIKNAAQCQRLMIGRRSASKNPERVAASHQISVLTTLA